MICITRWSPPLLLSSRSTPICHRCISSLALASLPITSKAIDSKGWGFSFPQTSKRNELRYQHQATTPTAFTSRQRPLGLALKLVCWSHGSAVAVNQMHDSTNECLSPEYALSQCPTVPNQVSLPARQKRSAVLQSSISWPFLVFLGRFCPARVTL